MLREMTVSKQEVGNPPGLAYGLVASTNAEPMWGYPAGSLVITGGNWENDGVRYRFEFEIHEISEGYYAHYVASWKAIENSEEISEVDDVIIVDGSMK